MPLLVPPELERLISLLDDVLEGGGGEGEEEEVPASRVTPSLFVHAAERARRAALSGAVAAAAAATAGDAESFPSSSSSECLDDVDALRSLLDSQQPLPARFAGAGGVHPAAAAATLLAFLLLLPRPLLPARAAALCDGAGRAPAPDAARDLLRGSMAPSEWATLGAVAGLARRVVEREGRARARARKVAEGGPASAAGFFPSARTPLPALLAEFLLPVALAPCSSSSLSSSSTGTAAAAAAAATAAAGGVAAASAADAPLSLSSLSLSRGDAGGAPRRFSASGGGLASPELAAAAAAALAAVADAADAAASARAELVATVIDRAGEWWPEGEL